MTDKLNAKDAEKIKEARAFCADKFKTQTVNPITEARQMNEVMKKYGLTQKQLAAALGKSRSSVANSLRLLTLRPEVLSLVSSNKLSAGHARTLVSLSPEKQSSLARIIISKKLSVRETENLVKNKANGSKTEFSPEFRDMLDKLQRKLGTKVSATGTESKGKLLIEYYSIDDLERICELLDLYDNF